jgi:8-oxo-dGTP diphosphatase
MVTFSKDRSKILLLQEFRLACNNWVYNFPGGLSDEGESPENTAKRELKEETGLEINPENIFQIGAYSEIDRDPRARTVTVAYLAIIDKPLKVQGSDDAAKADWFPISNLPDLAFDHDKIVKDAIHLYENIIKR